ncbi:uncharacterized protein MELLADRAFT_108587 [Melampsora larici-populina 98AG31]|uniref:Uncharacterized protein n=1 Tax=Melampsora larici-populina (strain 98AG31 / pathotype 3-4-7) TaxID=747676 RepID=F4RTK5_MELLP|nr:uncharacterized protein MELLADRAFT_108587 [Melampsora larici-populina 98AG31]EGG04322.1 hypothetical protein MELLADRAFT_108587 [Melampsora larici-populina 98AG31]
MSSHKYNFKPDSRRVVCRCQSSGCYKGFHIDAMGVSQQGVEVVPATREAHERADSRSRIHAASPLIYNQDPSRPNQLPSLIDSQHIITTNLDRLSLNSQTETVINNNQQQSMDSRVLEATQKARENGVHEYDCNLFHQFTLADFNPSNCQFLTA